MARECFLVGLISLCLSVTLAQTLSATFTAHLVLSGHVLDGRLGCGDVENRVSTLSAQSFPHLLSSEKRKERDVQFAIFA